MADKPINLTDAQLTTLKQVADPNYKGAYLVDDLLALHNLDFIYAWSLEGNTSSNAMLTTEGRYHLQNSGVEIPPPKTDKERIAELEAAIRDVLPNLPAVEPNQVNARYYQAAYNAYACRRILAKALGEE